MTITVILCTYNRSHSIVQALRSIAVQRFAGQVEWEVLVIDNNSKDDTRQVVERICNECPGRFRYVFEPQPGKSNALNTGLREARGGILAFTDDDVTVAPDWLANLTAPLYSSEWAGVGGRILLNWLCPPPRWLPLKKPYSLAGVLAGWDLGDQACELTDEVPIGANMAFRRRIFERYGSFRTDLGPNPANLMRSEDLEFGRRLVAGGERLCYEPAAIVYHSVSQNRVSQAYFLQWYFDFGRASAREFPGPRNQRCWKGIPRYLFRNLGERTLRWMVEFRPAMRFFRKAMVWQKAGEIAERYRQPLAAEHSMVKGTGPAAADNHANHSHSVHL